VSDRGLAGRIRRGAGWSLLSTLLLRMGNLVVGVVLARLLVPAEFGVFAIALTVQTVLMTLADLGLSADLIRSEDPQARAPTIATVSLLSGITLAVAMAASSGPMASLLGDHAASGAIAALSLALVLSTAGVVPYAMLQREFGQGRLFAAGAAYFVVYTTVTITLVEAAGMGAMALAWGSLLAQLTSTSMQFVLARVRPRFGFDRAIAKAALSYGVPLALANLLSWVVITFDNVAVARIAGVAALGLYVLAFNVSTWPMNAIGQVVRSVALPGFSELARRRQAPEEVFGKVLSVTWAAALPVGVLLAALSTPLVRLLYGERWGASATVLAALGFFGAARVVFDLMATFLAARGAARAVLWVQGIWTVALVPGVVIATHRWGLTGAGWSHVVIAVAVVLPAYVVVLRRSGVPVLRVLAALAPPLAAAVPTWWVAKALADAIQTPFFALLAGGTAGLATYAILIQAWVRRLLPIRSPQDAAMPDATIADPAGSGEARRRSSAAEPRPAEIPA
jgi:PST family polysaccharide transporter